MDTKLLPIPFFHCIRYAIVVVHQPKKVMWSFADPLHRVVHQPGFLAQLFALEESSFVPNLL